ncbi:polysaccharide biosynthesis tyrosine autokinase [Cognatishimia sp. WU-CL00825]|uniref:GumC family protein n=1 Tax=Cognatishimia sp. WU-CL00825 TaxID=3127658 RepID=UPI003104F832
MNLDRVPPVHQDPSNRDNFLPSIDLGEVLREMLAKLRRRWLIVFSTLVISVLLAIFYVANATPTYTANGAILIDPRVGQNPESGGQMMPGLLMSDALTVDSELRVLSSREVTTNTMRALGLDGETVLVPSLKQKLLAKLGIGGQSDDTGAALTDAAREERRIEAQRRKFVRNLKVQRAGDSFVVDISYSSSNLEFAPRAVNTLIKEYLHQSGKQNVEMIERNQVWLSDRIDELRDGVRAAESAVASYRRANDLLTPEGALLPTEIALNAAIGELVKLRGQALTIEVQAQQLSEQIAANEIEAVQVPLEERTKALADFEARFAELQQQEQELLLIWDEAAPAVRGVRQQKDQTQALIIGEYSQIQSRLRAQGEAMNRQVLATEKVIADLRDAYGDDTEKTLELRNLEREANAKRELYERLLEEFNSTSQLLTFDASSARVIGWAVVPGAKSSPKSRRVVILAVFAGLVIAIGAIFVLEALDQSFRTHTDVTRKLGLPFLGVIPAFESDQRATPPTQRQRVQRGKRWKKLSKAARKLDFAAVWPTSVSAESMRSIHVKLALQKEQFSTKGEGIILGFTSSVRDEGKTTTAFNFATFLARQNEKVVLVDMDLISHEMSRLVNTVLPSNNRLASFLQDPEGALSNLSAIPEFPGLHLIGNLGAGSIPPPTPRDAEGLAALLRYLRQHFDYVIVDLPPVQGAADTQLLARLCDRVIYAIKWGTTPQDQVMSSLKKSGLHRDDFFGVLFTRANLKKYRSYNRHEIADYYYA